MIHFYPELVAKIEKIIKDAHDCADIFCDLNRIEQVKANVNFYGNVLASEQLDRELREKYPLIDKMLNFANTMICLPFWKKIKLKRTGKSSISLEFKHCSRFYESAYGK